MTRVVPLFFLLLANAAFSAFSQSGGVITSVRVTGLSRTNPDAAEEPLRRFIGQEAASIDADEVKAAVIDQGILEPLSVTVEDTVSAGTENRGKTLVVEVKEKWSFFVGPFFYTGSGGTSAGLFVYDANAFGVNHKMIAGGMYENAGWRALAIYIIPPGGAGRFGWFANASFSEGEQRNGGADDKTLRRFNTRSIAAVLSPQYQISGALSITLNAAYTDTTILNSQNPVNAPDSGARFVHLGPEISVRKTGWDGYLLSEESASAGYRFVQDLSSPVWHFLSFKGVYEKSLVPGFRLNVRGGGLFGPDAPPLLENGPGDAGVAIFPGSFSARHYAGLSMGFEKYLYRFSFGTVSLFGAWQMAYSGGPILGNRFDYGAAGSLRFYLSRLAVPAMGAGVTYNIPAGYFQFSFSIGMTI
jgi:hypothetical protein